MIRSRHALKIGVWMVLFVLAFAIADGGPFVQRASGQAEDAAEPAAVKTDGDTAKEDAAESVGGLIVSSGTFGVIFYLVLGAFSVVALAVTIERMINLRTHKIMPPGFTAALDSRMQSDAVTENDLLALCNRYPSPIANVLHSGVIRTGRPLAEVEKAMEDGILREVSMLRGRNRVLSVVGRTAPLVGLLGTVVGMIFAFKISSQAGLGKAELLAEGIYLALMTTAAGLTIAIPCVLLAAWFNARVERYMWSIDETLLSTLPWFTRAENYTGPEITVAKADEQPALAE